MVKPRKPLRRVSKKRQAQLKVYAKVRVQFLYLSPYCERCNDTIEPRYRQLHHWAGRAHALLTWAPGFRMVCCSCHRWIETHRNEAVKLGLRAPDNLFNRPSLVIP
jgi:hypothetical protein